MAAYHKRPVVHIDGNGLNNVYSNLRPAKFGEVVTSRGMIYAENENGAYAHDLIVRWMYRARNNSPKEAKDWADYCARAGDSVKI
jgi:hypothetical protein